MILPKNQIKQFAQMKEAFQNADNSSDNEKQKKRERRTGRSRNTP